MADVDVVVHGEHWNWSFPGSDDALAAAFLAGAFPIGLSALWEGEAPTFAGEVHALTENPLLDRVVDFEQDGESWSAVLYIDDDEFRWTKLDAAFVAADGGHIHGPLGALGDRCRYEADGAAVTLLRTRALTDDDLVAVLRHPCTASLQTLELARPASAAVREALASQVRPQLRRLLWAGDLGEPGITLLSRVAPGLAHLKVGGTLAKWLDIVELDAGTYPTIPPAGLVVSDGAARVAHLLDGGAKGRWPGEVDSGVQVLNATLDLEDDASVNALLGVIAGLSNLEVLDLRGVDIAAARVPELRAKLPETVTLLRGTGGTHGHSVNIELHGSRDWMDWDLLYGLLDPLFEDWLSHVRLIARRLDLPGELTRALEPSTAAMEEVFPKVSDVLARLPVRGWQSLPVFTTEHEVGVWVEATVSVLRDFEGAVFRGDVGNDYLLYVERWLPVCVLTAGMSAAWLGDGFDGPVFDRAAEARVRALATRAAKRAGSSWRP